jgi:rubrerythrin
MKPKCVHSCKGLCNALTTAEQREVETIKEYRDYAEGCDYPEVKELLDTLAREREKMLYMLREKRAMLEVKFSMIDNITDSFS